MIPHWQTDGFMGGRGGHYASFADDDMGVMMCIYTPKRSDGSFGQPRERYGIKGLRKVFLTLDDMLDEWERRQRPGGYRIDEHCPKCGEPLDSTLPLAAEGGRDA